MSLFRIAVIGSSGAIGRRHVQNIVRHPDTELCATVNLLEPEQSGVPAFTDHVSMLEAVHPDGVIIATPNKLHVRMALECIERSVPVLVEKPISDDLGEARILADASERSGVPVLVGHHRRFSSAMRAGVAAISDGELGRLVSVVALHLRRKPDSYFDVQWRREAGGGPVLINGIHEIDALRMLCGEIKSVNALASNSIRGFEVEDTASVLLHFESGMLGTLSISDAVQAGNAWELTAGEDDRYIREGAEVFLIAGTAGSLSLPSGEIRCNAFGGGHQDPLVVRHLSVPQKDPWYEELNHFVQVARGLETPVVDAADATRTLGVTLAILESARRREWIDVNDFLGNA